MIEQLGSIGENTARQLEEVLMSDEPFEVMEFLMAEEKKALNRVLAYKQKQEQINRSRANQLPTANLTSGEGTGQSNTPSVQHIMPQINLNQVEPVKQENTMKSIKSNSNLLPDIPIFEPIDPKKL